MSNTLYSKAYFPQYMNLYSQNRLSARSREGEKPERACQTKRCDDQINRPSEQPVSHPRSLGANTEPDREMSNDHDPRDKHEPEQKRPYIDSESKLYDIDREYADQNRRCCDPGRSTEWPAIRRRAIARRQFRD